MLPRGQGASSDLCPDGVGEPEEEVSPALATFRLPY